MRQPTPVIPESVDVLRAEHRKAANGTDIYLLSTPEFEVLRFTFVFKAGTALQKWPFSASAAASLIYEGSQNMTASQIAEKLDYYGSYFDVNIDRDYAYISFCTLSRFFDQTLSVAQEILLRPIFPEEEIRAYCHKRKAKLEIERQKIETVAREAFAAAMFGAKHPYGSSSPIEAYDQLTRQMIVDFHSRHYTADNCFVVCSGKITEAEYSGIASLVEHLPRGHKAHSVIPAPTPKHIVHVARQGNVQSSIRIGRVLFPRTHPDFVGMQVVATLLGGYFSSRLMQNLREERGYTYGVMAAMVNLEQTGYLAVATQVATDVRDDALLQIYNEIERLRTEQVEEHELMMVKNMMIGEMMRILDGPFGIADVTIENILCGTDNAQIERNVKIIRAITPDQILSLCQRYLDRHDLVEVIVG